MNNVQIKTQNYFYLALSACSGFLELGVIFFALHEGATITVALLVGFSYQVGALLKNPLQLSVGGYRILLIVAAIMSIFTPYSFFILVITMGILAAGLQGIRDEAVHTATVTTMQKRLSRVMGFIFAGLFCYPILTILPVFCIIGSIMLSQNAQRPTILPLFAVKLNWRVGKLGVIMITHQAHYFCYCYTLLYILTQHFSIVWSGIAFAGGWVTYALAQRILHGVREIPGFVVGHLFVASILLVLFFKHENSLALLGGWLLTGFGGGTIFLLRRLQPKIDILPVDLDLWENIGHVIGVLISIGIVVVTTNPIIPFVVATALAIASAIQLLLKTHNCKMLFSEDYSV